MAVVSQVAEFLKGIETGWSEPAQRMRLAHQFLRDAWLIERGQRQAHTGHPDDAIDGLEAALAKVAQI